MTRITRRLFIETTGAGLAAITAWPLVEVPVSGSQSAASAEPVPTTRITLRVNGTDHTTEVEDRWTLAEVLRDDLDLTGTKIGCDRGQCGACTVLMDGKPIYSCSTLAVWTDGREILTVEGLADGDRLDPLQVAFIAHDGPQCGFCTSGQLMTAKALIMQNAEPTSDDVRRAMVGNICRCSNYNRYVEAVLAAAARVNARA